MRLSWPQHLQASRTVQLAPDGQRGEALALMGVSLLILMEDLLAEELQASGSAFNPALGSDGDLP